VDVATEDSAPASRSRRATKIALWVLVGACCLVGPSSHVLRSLPKAALGHTAAAAAASAPVPFTVEPADGSTSVMPSTVVTLTSPDPIQQVQVGDHTGAVVAGQLDASTKVWRATGALFPGRQYTIDADLLDRGQVKHVTTHFQTVPGRTVSTSVMPANGSTVGVGMPIVLRFAQPIKSQDNFTRAVTVSAASGVEIRSKWFSPYELHFRPQNYWTAGDKVSVDINLAGVDAGANTFGTLRQHLSFTIGSAHVSTVDVVSHRMTVTENGQVVRSMLISAGRPKYPTMNGVHFVWGKAPMVVMDSATVGIPRNSPDGYYEKVQWNVQITTGGEYVHSAPWSVQQQGTNNVSHGCVNASPTDAKWYYNFSRVGDIVQVTGSPRPPTAKDGSADWNTAWTQWTPLSTATTATTSTSTASAAATVTSASNPTSASTPTSAATATTTSSVPWN
jgi:lipoprotein-anchoring transpeptidase ErfK/SrfK